MGKMRMLSVGASVSKCSKSKNQKSLINVTNSNMQCVWAVNAADEVFVRVGLNEVRLFLARIFMITKAKKSCCWSRYKTCKTHQVDPRGKEWTKIDGSMKSVRCQTNKSKQMKNASIDGDGDGDGYPAYSHHDKISPWWGIVSNDEGGNVPVSKTHHTP